MDYRMFSYLRKPFARALKGDLATNLEAIVKSPVEPASRTLRQARDLYIEGYPFCLLVNALETYKEAPCSILDKEQMHGSGSCQHQHHKVWGWERCLTDGVGRCGKGR